MKYPEQDSGIWSLPRNTLTKADEAAILAGTWQGPGTAPKQAKGEVMADGLTRHQYTDITGRTISEYSGEPSMWMDQFKPQFGLLQLRINNQPKPDPMRMAAGGRAK